MKKILLLLATFFMFSFSVNAAVSINSLVATPSVTTAELSFYINPNCGNGAMITYDIYVNGVQENAGIVQLWNGSSFVNQPANLITGSTTASVLNKINNKFTLGGGTAGTGLVDGNKVFQGMIDEFYIFNRALTVAEIINIKNTTPTYLSNQDFAANNLKISLYPNPAKDNFTIDMENEVKSIEIYSLQGQKVITATSKNVNVANLSKGIYMVRIEDTYNAVATKKLVIE